VDESPNLTHSFYDKEQLAFRQNYIDVMNTELVYCYDMIPEIKTQIKQKYKI